MKLDLNRVLNPNESPEDEISYDESVCSAEFSEGCTIPAKDQTIR